MANFVVGLTGGIGCGKTTVANMFIDLGVEVIDADIIARQVVQPHSAALISIESHFGESFILPSGELNRQVLRSEVFSNEQSKIWLNNLLHPLIRKNIESALQTATSKKTADYCLLVAPLLIENNLLHLVNRVLVIDVDERTQLDRILARDNGSEQEIKAIIGSQLPRDKRLDAANDIINNSCQDLTALKAQVMKHHGYYRDFSQK